MANRPLTIACLEAVQAVAATGSMSAAAARLGRSQSAVSQLVSQAESSLGCTLFDRSSRPFRATQSGGELLRHAAGILHDLQALPQRMGGRGGGSLLRIAMVDSVANTLGADLVRYAAGYGGDLYVSQGLTPAHVNDLLERRVDVIVASDTMDEHDGLSRFPILTERFVLLHPAARTPGREGPVDLADLAGQLPFIRYTSRSTTGAIIERYLRRLRVSDTRRIEVDNADMMCALVGNGVGWAITTPLHIMQTLQRLEGVRVDTLRAPVPERSVTLITRAGEFEETASMLAAEARRLLQERYLPLLFDAVPAMAREIQVAPEFQA